MFKLGRCNGNDITFSSSLSKLPWARRGGVLKEVLSGFIRVVYRLLDMGFRAIYYKILGLLG